MRSESYEDMAPETFFFKSSLAIQNFLKYKLSPALYFQLSFFLNLVEKCLLGKKYTKRKDKREVKENTDL